MIEETNSSALIVAKPGVVYFYYLYEPYIDTVEINKSYKIISGR